MQTAKCISHFQTETDIGFADSEEAVVNSELIGLYRLHICV